MEAFNLPFRALCSTTEDTRIETFVNGCRMETPPQGGGAHLDAGTVPASVWADYNYMTANVYHESHDVLVVLFTFTDEANRSITIHYGVLPRVITRICLPLTALNGEKLFLERFPGVMQSVLRGDAFVDRNRIARFSISTIASISYRSMEISELSLCRSEPSFHYESTSYIDVLGQLAGKDWEGKTLNSDELVRSLKAEWQYSREQGSIQSEYGRYGGWKQLRFEYNGYFRTQHDGQRWWFVDPEGYALFSTGMDCIHPAEAMRVSGMEHLLPQHFDTVGDLRDAWVHRGYSFGIANLIRAFGAEWWGKWKDLTEHRMKLWGLNTIGNWSSPEYIRQSELPYVYPMEDFPTTEQKIYRDFPDVFNLEYEKNAAAFSMQLLEMRDDRRLIGYFMRNEPHWAFVENLNLTEQMLRLPVRFASKIKFVEWLIHKYITVGNWNAAWNSSFERFDDMYDETKCSEWTDNPTRQEDFNAYNRLMIRRYVEVPAKYCKQADPHHLNMGMRYAWVGSDDLLEGCEAFDVFSINCYQMEPARELIQHISHRINKPVMIGEFHFGAADVGMLAYGIRALADQFDRGMAYQYFVEQAAAIPELIGVHYFQLNDQPILGRLDGENYQIGVVDVCQQPYRPFVEAMKRTHKRMYNIRIGKVAPNMNCPKEIPKTGF